MDHQGSRRFDSSLAPQAPTGGQERYLRAPVPGKGTRVSRVYRSAAGPAAARPDQGAAGSLERAAQGTGHALPDALRTSLEQALGTRLDHVRLHSDGASAEAARSIRASAYAIGNDIFFAGGTYAPDDLEGQRLIAHEVAHTVQTGGGSPAARPGELEISQPGDDHEVEADRFADDFVAGRPAALPAARGGGVARSVIHRSPEDDKKPAATPEKSENQKALEKIQGYAMFALLPALRDVQPAAARTDEATARAVGGPRLVLAMRAVNHGGGWLDFVTAQQQTLAGIPGDQISDLMAFLGAPANTAYFSEDHFDSQFDGLVDPSTGNLTLFWRVKVQAGPGAKFGRSLPPTQAWQNETKIAIEKFKKDLPGAIEKTWKATIKPANRIPSLASLRCQVKVTVVESGEHKVVHVMPDIPGGRSRMGQKKGEDGTFREEANQEHDGEVPVSDEKGQLAQKDMKVRQSGSAHEFGHAVGLNHPRCNDDKERCYGLLPDEKSSVMGYGDQINLAKNGHNDFEPFQRIATEWGKTYVYPGPLSPHNRWLPG